MFSGEILYVIIDLSAAAVAFCADVVPDFSFSHWAADNSSALPL
jgi:hypothetical protein